MPSQYVYKVPRELLFLASFEGILKHPYLSSSTIRTQFKMISSISLLPYLGCISYFASPLLASILPALTTRATPFNTRILDVGSTFYQENNGVWQLIEYVPLLAT